MLWAAYALPVLLKVLQGLKNSSKDKCLDLSIYTKPITCLYFHRNCKHVQCVYQVIVNKSKWCFAYYDGVKLFQLNSAWKGYKGSIELPSKSESKRVYHRQYTVKLNHIILIAHNYNCVCSLN